MTRILTLEEDFHATNIANNGLAHAGVKCGADDSNWYHAQYGSDVVNGVLVQIFLADLILVYWVPRNEGLRA